MKEGAAAWYLRWLHALEQAEACRAIWCATAAAWGCAKTSLQQRWASAGGGSASTEPTPWGPAGESGPASRCKRAARKRRVRTTGAPWPGQHGL